MKLLLRYGSIGSLIIVIIVSAIWIAAKYRASPTPIGEAYRFVPDWPHVPDELILGQVAGVDVDSRGRVFVFHRAERVWNGEPIELKAIASSTILVLDAGTGEVIDQWGNNMFVMPHGLTIDHEDHLWLTDVGLHQVFEFDLQGNLLMTLGERGIPGVDGTHFNMPTDVAIAPDGTFYVSDGYVNSRISKFSKEGVYMTSWGMRGALPGQFDVPHSIALDAEGRIYVADRGNARVQIFDENGIFFEEWKNAAMGRPWAVRFDASGNLYMVDGGDQNRFWPDRARVLKLDAGGNILAAFGSYGRRPGQFIWPHTIAIGPDGALYVGEVATGMRIQKFVK